jgi:hypothetical protein
MSAMPLIVVAGALANKPWNGGAAWTRLSWLLGFQQLGCDVYFIEQIAPGAGVADADFFTHVTSGFGLDERSTLISAQDSRSIGLRANELADLADAADLLVNISGHLTLDTLKPRFRKRIFIDLDPGYTQFWHAQGLAQERLRDHQAYFTVGENIGTPACDVPTNGIDWQPIRQPVLLDEWPAVPAPPRDRRFTTVASWRGAYGRVTHDGLQFGVKAHEFRKFAALPTMTEHAFEIALDVDPADGRDVEALQQQAWHVVDANDVTGDPFAFRRYIQESAAECSVAQGIYVETHSGWFSDRTVRYLASGKPALVQDTGFAQRYSDSTDSCGLVPFNTLEEAARGADRIMRDYDEHARAARAIAEEYFDSNTVLRNLLALVFSLFAMVGVALAQQPPPATGGVHGTVTDPTGAIVIGASVTLQNGPTQRWSTTTTSEGTYAFEQIPPGRYALSIHYDGFRTFAARVDVKSGEVRTQDARLEVGISVTTDVQSTDLRKNLSTLVLTGKELAMLPDDPERFLQRILEMAGSTGRPNDVAILVDGFREYKRLPPKNTIEMIRINSNPFSAEFAQQGLDRIEIVTKPGSDTFHGEIRLQGGDSALDAKNPLAPTKADERTRTYNGYLQGPIVKGRLDFIAYAGQWQQDENATIHATTLDPVTNTAGLLSNTVTTPTRTTSVMGGTNFTVANQRFNVTFTQNEETRRNQGLDTGLELPEYAFNRSTTDQIGRLWWTSIVNAHTVNDVRVEISRNRATTSPLSSTPAVIVLDAFYAGGNQSASTRATTTGTQASETLTMQFGKHLAKGGLLLETAKQDSLDRSGFGGQFIFGTDVERDAAGNPVLNDAGQTIPISPIENYRRTRLGLPGYAPSQFSIVRGTPDIGVNQWTLGWFALDDWSISNRLSLSYGLRQDMQNNVAQRVTVEPRAALSWLLDANGKNAIKVGGGLFYGRVEPGITLDTKKVNGIDRQQFIIGRPLGYPAIPVSSLDAATAVQSAIYTKSSDLQMPRSAIATISYERQLVDGLFVVGQYTYNKGSNLLRLVNISTGTSPNLQFESNGRSLQRQLMLGLRGNISRELTLYANYTYGKKTSDTDGAYTTPAKSHDLANEYGPAFDDQRHTFVAGTTIYVDESLMITPSLTIASGRPFNITTGLDNNGDTLFSDRPSFAKAGDTDAIMTPYGLLNPNPQPGETIIPRNYGREQAQVAVNLSVSQTFAKTLVFTFDADNLLNNSRLVKSNGVLTSPTFGFANQALNGRRLLLSLRYAF